MADVQRTYTFTANLTKGGHRRLDEVLETCRELYNDYLTARKTAYNALGATLNGKSQSAPVKQNRAAGDEPIIPQPDARMVYVNTDPPPIYGGMSMTGLGPAQRKRRAAGYGCTVAELEPPSLPHSIRRELNPGEVKELAAARRSHNSYRLWRALWPSDAEQESLREQYAWTRWRNRNAWPALDDALENIDDKSSLSNHLTAIRKIDPDLEGINRRLEVATVIERLDKAFSAYFDRMRRDLWLAC